MTTFYAWASPAFFSNSFVDHTWVTTYDSRQVSYPDIAAVVKSGVDYWFCWGDYRVTGGVPGNQTGYLGRKSGNRALAQCLVRPNVDSRHDQNARGTIFIYGRDGVCHQLSNQVLYATTGARLTVRNARGYFFSSALYGTYGQNDNAWASKVQSCTAPSTGGMTPMGGDMQPEKNLPDEFTEHASAVLADDPGRLEALLALRAQAQIAVRDMPDIAFSGPDAAAIINARNQEFLDQAAEVLGPSRFEQVFGFPAGEKVDLVDPEMLGGGMLQRE